MSSAPEPSQPHHSTIVHEGHQYGVCSIAFSPDGKSISSGSDDGTVRMWDAHSPSPIGEPLTGHTNWVKSISYSSLGNLVASGSADATLRIWDVNTGGQLGEPLGGDHWFFSVSFSLDANLLASGCGGSGPKTTEHSVQLWDVHKRVPACGPLKGHTDAVRSVGFSPDGTHVVSGSIDRTIRIWDVQRGVTIIEPIKAHNGSVNSVSFSPDGSQVVSCSDDRTLRFWDARSGDIVSKPYEGHTNRLFSVAYSPNGTYVASGGVDGTVRIWDVRTARQVDEPFKEHRGWVQSVAFSPCGYYVASGSGDKKIIIRSILGKATEPSESSDTPEDEGTLLQNENTQIFGQMSLEQIFDCLVVTGCVDLSSHMNTNQDTAMIVSGGGFGDIWKGDLNNGTKVAIKAWRSNMLEQCSYKTLKRAARELHYWSRMKHKNIHQLMGVIMFKGIYLGMVSEWLENGNLHEYLRKNPDADRHQLCLDVASGLTYMHSQSTVHGDLKAANVLVSSDGVGMISDFDFSVMSEATSLVFTATSNSRTGSLRWAAPEMLPEEAPQRTKQSDVYALGMTMLASINLKD
ncbi:unnamed protein product [Rhizoctonia solani]|uniref:Protein kinase domain-containing protein n=1 Tax=Rhizoctonia solani TaxID=456999 RepID=A0A8H3BWR0_9AGAM|nr:unnamed protein product [Rhizoctonia solani]